MGFTLPAHIMMMYLKKFLEGLSPPLPFVRLLLCYLVVAAGLWAAEIAYDKGGNQFSTVIGYYVPEHRAYILGVDFSLMSPETFSHTTVLVHAHVGSDIKAVQSETKPRIAVRVNGGAWHWQSLTPFQDGRTHWLEIEVPVGEWRAGLNRVEINSNVTNPSNRTSETLDILGCSQPPIQGRSMYSVDEGRTFSIQNDRNWGIRLKYEERMDMKKTPCVVNLRSPSGIISVNKSVQYIVDVFDADGNRVSSANARWSAKGGTIDEWGLFRPERTGKTLVSVSIGDLTTTRTGEVVLKMPPGVEPPDSDRRLISHPLEGHRPLSGRWEFRLDRQNRGDEEEWFLPANQIGWGEIVVPGSWQAQGYGLDYHGVGWYRRSFALPAEWTGKQVWIQFHGVATKATVWLNGIRVGEHVGNWAPFTFRLTDALKPSGDNILVVRVEEMPEHFSAGFPKEIGRFVGIDSHFGGLWQDVALFATGSIRVDDVFVLPHLQEQEAELHIALDSQTARDARILCYVLDRENRKVAMHEIRHEPVEKGHKKIEISLNIPAPEVWSPQSPYLYTAVVEIFDGDVLSDKHFTRFGMRSVESKGTQILLNGKPLMVRGMLHWGYYPDLFTIDPSEERIRQEFEDLRAAGFNLVKVCLFMFPRRFYEIADETGMLLWQEYPTWLYVNFPQAGDNRLDKDFAREYPEWFRYDRNHPSIILRDLTCEAHINPNWDLLERTYRIGKEMTGGALICDNSSFFKHHITDWYVCHTYRDLDEYYKYLATLVDDMRKNLKPKPFLFGEDFDADTYRDSQAIHDAFVSDTTPWWLDNANFQEQLRFDDELRRFYGSGAPKRLVDMQKQHGLALRKAYFEEFRRYPEPAGFVMTSLRDITATRPGFYDDILQQKWHADEWQPFNADRVLVLYSERRSRCFRVDESIQCDLILSNYSEDVVHAPFRWRLMHTTNVIARGSSVISAERGEIRTVASLRLELDDSFTTTPTPLTCRLEAELGQQGEVASNIWNVWLFPTDDNARMAAGVTIFGYSPDGGEHLISSYPGLQIEAIQPSSNDGWTKTISRKNSVLLTDTIDDPIKAALREGMNVIYLPGSKEPGFYNRQGAPFWRETAIWLPEGSALGDFPHEGFIDLQFLDMTQRKPFVLGASRNSGKPLVWGISARNPGGAIYDYVFETRFENKGHLLACCLNLAGENNVAGRHLLRCMIQYIVHRPSV